MHLHFVNFHIVFNVKLFDVKISAFFKIFNEKDIFFLMVHDDLIKDII